MISAGIDGEERARVECDRNELERLTARFAHRVPFFAGRVQQRFMLGERWRDELLSAGYWGLFKALLNRRHDAHDRELSAYVSRRIEGAVIDEARVCLACASTTDSSEGARLHGIEERDDGRTRSASATGLLADSVMVSREVAADPEREVAARRRRAAIATALGSLEPEARDVLVAYMEGDSLCEIARARGISAGTMQVRFQKLAQRMRAHAPTLRQVLLDAMQD